MYSYKIATALAPFRWTRARYEQLAATGILHDTHCELVDGQIVEIEVTISPRHAHTVEAIGALLRDHYGARRVRSQQPIALSDHDEPEPDLLVTPVDDLGSRAAHPRGAVLVIEVADSTLREDRTLKCARYARAGVPVYWIVNLVDDQVETFSRPDRASGDYLARGVASWTDRIGLPGLIGDHGVTAAELLA